MPENPQNVDQLRDRLRALGYLDAPVDRYVLGSGTSRAGAARFALGAGLRVGLLAGMLLGVSAAIALAARAPGLIATRRDALVLAGALSILFAVITALAVAGTAIAAAWYARRAANLTPRRARAVAAVAGIAVALACAIYLTLWWNAAQDALTSLTFGWNAAAVAMAALISLLLAHAVSLVILAALARSQPETGIAAGGLLSSRGFLAAFGVVLFAGSIALLAAGRETGGTDASPPPITVVPTRYAVRVVAIDGFDLTLAERLSTGGRLPALQRLLEGGYMPLRPEAGQAPDPARDWTTIATGRPPAVHGIASLEARRAVGIGGALTGPPAGMLRPLLYAADLLRLTTPAVASGVERRAPAFWEVAAAAGLRTSVVNWWATWPAPAGDDIVITDRALLRLDTGGALDAEIAPASLYEPLRVEWPRLRTAAAARASAAFASIADAELRALIVRSAELDMLAARLANANPGPALDLSVLYLPGLDIAQHSLLQRAPGSVSAMRERLTAIERYYEFLDGLVGALLPPSGAHIDVAILWPGRAGIREGAMVLAGEPIQGGHTICEDCVLGAASTLLYLLGLPIADNLESNPMTEAVSVAFKERHPIRRIASYDAVNMRRGARTGQPLDAEALERLRSLGYIDK
ncbi:MAG: alkaline phosphatase family protein [Vicinamibacterales bacterium]